MTARPSQAQTNKKNNDDYTLLQYRVGVVENAFADFSRKFDTLDSINRSDFRADLAEFRDTIINRISDSTGMLQKQIDSKADKQEFKDFKSQQRSLTVFQATLFIAVLSYIFTRLH